jgi:hypothetical protein
MKLLKLLPLLLPVILVSCKLDPSLIKYNNVVIPLDQKSVPETATVNTPLSIYAKATAENGCWSNIHFVFDTLAAKEFELYALADFESNGVCPTIALMADTVINITPVTPGEYTIKFWNSASTWDIDTINVVIVVPEK